MAPEAALSLELARYPSVVEELQAIQEDAYDIALSSPTLMFYRSSSHSSGSRVESIVTRVLTSEYVQELQVLVDAGTALFEEAEQGDKESLLCFWREGIPLPVRLLYRYNYFRDLYGLPIPA